LARLAALIGSAAVLVAQGDHTNAFTGTWKLNVAKSKFNPGPPPQSVTVTSTPDGTFSVEEVDGQGKPVKFSHPWSGGKEVPVNGIENATWISNVRSRTIDDTMKVGGKTVEKVHVVLSPDGKTVTATIDETDPNGQRVHNVEVYEKQ
jgi:hypothetical protein